MSSPIEPRMARAFHRLGWIGFWVQTPLLLLPIVALIYVLTSKAAGGGASLRFVNYLAFIGLAIMAFTAFWSHRYTRLARRLSEPDAGPAWTSVARKLWIGIAAAFLGMVVSLLLLIIEVWGLLFLLLKTPQGGVPVMRTSTDDRTSWVSTINVVSLLAELCTLASGVLVLGISLWLLFRLVALVGCFDNAGKPTVAAAPQTPA